MQALARLADVLQVSPWDLVTFAGWPVPVCPCQQQEEKPDGLAHRP
jgi:hypothetical protein